MPKAQHNILVYSGVSRFSIITIQIIFESKQFKKCISIKEKEINSEEIIVYSGVSRLALINILKNKKYLKLYILKKTAKLTQ